MLIQLGFFWTQACVILTCIEKVMAGFLFLIGYRAVTNLKVFVIFFFYYEQMFRIKIFMIGFYFIYFLFLCSRKYSHNQPTQVPPSTISITRNWLWVVYGRFDHLRFVLGLQLVKKKNHRICNEGCTWDASFMFEEDWELSLSWTFLPATAAIVSFLDYIKFSIRVWAYIFVTEQVLILQGW